MYHDSAAALVSDGEVVSAVQEERFSRKKHDSSFPINAVQHCLRERRLTLEDLDYIVFYEKPFLKFERLLETYMSFAPRGFRSFAMAMPLWVRDKLFQRRLLRKELERNISGEFDWSDRLLFAEHHQSHAASAFFPSPFDSAVVLTIDGVGEWATATVGVGRGNQLEMHREIHFPHSLGLLYSAFTYYTGFRVNSGEYKVMGLAPYGEPRFAQTILDNLIDVKPDGTFRLDLSYFDYCTGLRMTNARFDKLLGGPPRSPDEPLTQRHMDLAASIQAVTEEVVLALTRGIAKEYDERNLCLAGGVALNCVANGRVLRDGKFSRIWVQPAAGDAGGALGAALLAHHHVANGARNVNANGDGMRGSFLGPEYSQDEIEHALRARGARFELLRDGEMISQTAEALAEGLAVGWFQGRMEFGPRALGARSILADARSPSMQSVLNLKVKFRESFRPFAPAVLCEDVRDWFDLDVESPYMSLVAKVTPSHCYDMRSEEQSLFGIEKLNAARSDIPAVTHVDYSARIQTVDAERNQKFHALLSAFKALTGCPVLVNTSFNVRGEPIVCTPEDAFRCFMGTELDVLAIGNCYLRKEKQEGALSEDYKAAFALD